MNTALTQRYRPRMRSGPLHAGPADPIDLADGR